MDELYPRISLRIPEDLRDALELCARQQGITVSAMVKKILTEYLRANLYLP